MNPYTQNPKQRKPAPNQLVVTELPKQRSLLALFAILTMLLITLTISGCVGLTSAGAPTKTGSTSTPSSTLAASTTSFTFGNVAPGLKSLQTLTLTNNGTSAIMISNVTVTGAGFSVVGGMSSVSIAAGQSQGFQIQFAPQATGNINGSLVVVSNALDSTLTISLSGTGMAAPSITTQPASQSVAAGQTATFTVAAIGSGTLSYQWKRNGTAISGAISSIYATPATTASDNGASFTVVVSDITGAVNSNAATLTVTSAPVAPSITTQPASRTVTSGQIATFAVTASGTATLTYQWKKNGIAMSGATSASYTTPATANSDSGASFSVTVSNTAGNVTSNAATLTVTSAPVAPAITAQPASQGVAARQTATFAVTASGTATLTYQWKKNGIAMSGATSASYTTPATANSDSGASFSVTVSNTAGNVTSNAATLTVTSAPVAPSITAQPARQGVAAGQTATFAVTASGTATLTYQWKKNGIAMSGATSASYTTPATTNSDSGASFSVTVSNTAGNVTSNAATLTVTSAPVAPSITAQPASQGVAAGQTAKFTVTASGAAPLTYQWKKNGIAMSGATSASYTTPATTNSDSGASFSVTVSNTAGNVTSNAATLTVTSAPVAPSITAQPASQGVAAGQTATFTVTASGAAPLTYQWKKNGSAIGGATSASYTTPATTNSDNGASFSVTVSNTAGNVTRNDATLTDTYVPVAPSIKTQPASRTVTSGQTATFAVTASGTATLTYQWMKNGAAIGGATSASYTTPATTSSDNGASFSVIVSNNVGNVTRDPKS